MKKLKTLIAMATVLAMGYSGAGIASASEMASDGSPSAMIAPAATVCSDSNVVLTPEEQKFADVLAVEIERFNSVSDNEDVERTAAELYPNDLVQQQKYIEFSSEPLAEFYEVRALPAIVIAAIPVIAACVARGLSGAALDQVVNALRGNNLAKADDLIWSFAAGCVGFGPLKWAFNKAKPVAARALTWAVEQALKVAGKFKK